MAYFYLAFSFPRVAGFLSHRYLVMCVVALLACGLALSAEAQALADETQGQSSFGEEISSKFASEESSYQIGPEDVLRISVWKDEILSREVIVRPDGFITFPLVGEVRAEGHSVGSLAKEMDVRLTKFVSDPRVTIGVSQVNSFKIFVIGKVNNPGGFQIGQYTDVMQALSLAGGLTPFAREGSVKVLRRDREIQTTFPFDYSEVLQGESLEQNIVLQRGDIVMVP